MRIRQQYAKMTVVAKRAYAAGLIDGEGYISIYHQKQFKTASSYYRMKVLVAMCDSGSVRALQSTWGGRCHTLSNRHAKGGKNNRPITRWYLCADHAAKLLTDILPFLIVKRPHAELAIAFQAHVRKHRGWQHHSAVMPEDARMLRHAMYLRMRELNKRGV